MRRGAGRALLALLAGLAVMIAIIQVAGVWRSDIVTWLDDGGLYGINFHPLAAWMAWAMILFVLGACIQPIRYLMGWLAALGRDLQGATRDHTRFHPRPEPVPHRAEPKLSRLTRRRRARTLDALVEEWIQALDDPCIRGSIMVPGGGDPVPMCLTHRKELPCPMGATERTEP